MASLEVVEIDPMPDLLFNGFENCTTEMLLERNLNCVLGQETGDKLGDSGLPHWILCPLEPCLQKVLTCILKILVTEILNPERSHIT